MSPERCRRRSTERVSTSARSGTDASPAAARAARAARPSDPSSPTIAANTEASRTINGGRGPLARSRPHPRCGPCRFCASRCEPARRREAPDGQGFRAQTSGTAGVTARHARPVQPARGGRLRGGREPTHSACLQFASTLVESQRAVGASADSTIGLVHLSRQPLTAREVLAAPIRLRRRTPRTEALRVLGCGMPRRERILISCGDVWDATIPGVGTHPVVVVTRATALPVLSSLVCVLVTSSFMVTLRRWAWDPTRDSTASAQRTATTGECLGRTGLEPPESV